MSDTKGVLSSCLRTQPRLETSNRSNSCYLQMMHLLGTIHTGPLTGTLMMFYCWKVWSGWDEDGSLLENPNPSDEGRNLAPGTDVGWGGLAQSSFRVWGQGPLQPSQTRSSWTSLCAQVHCSTGTGLGLFVPGKGNSLEMLQHTKASYTIVSFKPCGSSLGKNHKIWWSGVHILYIGL